MKQHTRIAFAGDWHANTHWARQMVDYAAQREAECIVHLGDYGWQYMHAFVKDMQHMLRRAGLHAYVIDGNHEDFTKLWNFPLQPDGTRKISPNVHYLPRGYRFDWDGLRFMACGGAVSVDKHLRSENLSWWPQEQITDEDVRTCAQGGPVDVLLTHDCPTGVDIPYLDKASPYFPAAALTESDAHRTKLLTVASAATPKLIFHGHYHRAYTQSVNLGWGPVRVQGLDCDATDRNANMAFYDTTFLKALAGIV